MLPVDARAWPRWAGVLLLGLFLALLLSQWNRLRVFLRRFGEMQVNAKKTFS